MAALRELLLALRALIDWYLERLERRREQSVEVQDIPILVASGRLPAARTIGLLARPYADMSEGRTAAGAAHAWGPGRPG